MKKFLLIIMIFAVAYAQNADKNVANSSLEKSSETNSEVIGEPALLIDSLEENKPKYSVRDSIDQELRQMLPQLKKIYTRFIKQKPDLKGVIEVKGVVDAEGTILRLSILKSNTENALLDAEIQDYIQHHFKINRAPNDSTWERFFMPLHFVD